MKMRVKAMTQYKHTISLVTKHGELYLPKHNPKLASEILRRACPHLVRPYEGQHTLNITPLVGRYINARVESVHNYPTDTTETVLIAGD